MGKGYKGLWKPPGEEELEIKLDLQIVPMEPAPIRASKIPLPEPKPYAPPKVPKPRLEEKVREQAEKELEELVLQSLADEPGYSDLQEIGELIGEKFEEGYNTSIFGHGDRLYIAAERGQFRGWTIVGRIAETLSLAEGHLEKQGQSIDRYAIHYFFEPVLKHNGLVDEGSITTKLYSRAIKQPLDEEAKSLKDIIRLGTRHIRNDDKLPPYAVAIGIEVGEEFASNFNEKAYKDGKFLKANYMWWADQLKVILPSLAAIIGTAAAYGGVI